MFLTSVVISSLTRFYGAGRVGLIAVASAARVVVLALTLGQPLQYLDAIQLPRQLALS